MTQCSVSMDSSDEEVVITALLCEMMEQKRKRRHWVHSILKKRITEGEFQTLFSKLMKDSIKFYRYFRMNYEQFGNLLEIVKPDTEKKIRLFGKLSAEERLAVCLLFLAIGDSFRSVAFSYRLGETTIRKIVYSTSDIIWRKLGPKVMPAPTQEIWEKSEYGFSKLWNFPNCIGALDGKHVVIEAPSNSGSLYFNYKKTYSIVLLAVVDANYQFVVVNVGAYGKNSDGGILAESNLGKLLIEDNLNILPPKTLPGTNVSLPHVIVGDEAFPLHKNIMRPYPRASICNADYNNMLTCAEIWQM